LWPIYPGQNPLCTDCGFARLRPPHWNGASTRRALPATPRRLITIPECCLMARGINQLFSLATLDPSRDPRHCPPDYRGHRRVATKRGSARQADRDHRSVPNGTASRSFGALVRVAGAYLRKGSRRCHSREAFARVRWQDNRETALLDRDHRQRLQISGAGAGRAAALRDRRGGELDPRARVTARGGGAPPVRCRGVPMGPRRSGRGFDDDIPF